MKLYVNDAPMGDCKSYEQIRNAPRPGWLFRMETGISIFIPFDEIRRFTSGDGLSILTENA